MKLRTSVSSTFFQIVVGAILPPCDMVDRSEGARRREAGLAVRRVERVSHHHAVARFAADMLRIPPETPHGSRTDAIDTGVYVPHLEVAVVERYCRRIIKSGRSTPREPVARDPHTQRVELDHAEDSQLDAHLYWLAEVCCDSATAGRGSA